MYYNTEKIVCSRGFTVVRRGPQTNILENQILSGYKCGIKYSSFLCFDRSGLPENAISHSAYLKIFLNDLETQAPFSTLFAIPSAVQPMLQDGFDTALKNFCPDCCVRVPRGFKGWLTIDLGRSFSDALCGESGSFSIALLTDENNPVMFNFEPVSCGQTEFAPHLLINYSLEKPSCCTTGCTVNIEENSWELSSTQQTSTPPVPIERLKMGSFFVTNTGSVPFTAILETSADSYEWVFDNEELINPGTTEILVGKYYGKYYRIRITSSGSYTATVKFIAQLYPSSRCCLHPEIPQCGGTIPFGGNRMQIPTFPMI